MQILTEPELERTSNGPEIFHLKCCDDENLSMCGQGIGHLGEAEADEIECVVCAELDELNICPRTGRQCPYPPED